MLEGAFQILRLVKVLKLDSSRDAYHTIKERITIRYDE